MLGEDKRFELLIHESSQMHENIQRCLDEMNKLVGYVFPALTGLFVVVSEGNWISKEQDAYALLSGVSGLILIVFNVTWMQMISFADYKYAQILPRLYEITQRQGENFGEYSLQGGIARPTLGVLVLQIVPAVICIASLHAGRTSTFFGPCLAAAVIALFTAIASWLYFLKVGGKVR